MTRDWRRSTRSISKCEQPTADTRPPTIGLRVFHLIIVFFHSLYSFLNCLAPQKYVSVDASKPVHLSVKQDGPVDLFEMQVSFGWALLAASGNS